VASFFCIPFHAATWLFPTVDCDCGEGLPAGEGCACAVEGMLPYSWGFSKIPCLAAESIPLLSELYRKVVDQKQRVTP